VNRLGIPHDGRVQEHTTLDLGDLSAWRQVVEPVNSNFLLHAVAHLILLGSVQHVSGQRDTSCGKDRIVVISVPHATVGRQARYDRGKQRRCGLLGHERVGVDREFFDRRNLAAVDRGVVDRNEQVSARSTVLDDKELIAQRRQASRAVAGDILVNYRRRALPVVASWILNTAKRRQRYEYRHCKC